ncbi:MAG: STAS domain-containing protein [Planctomycetota bacterium]|nr:STAS domain-containing protein [Planctomycetota bacterium]
MVDNARVRTEFRDGVVLATVRCEKITDFDTAALQGDIADAAKLHGWRLIINMSGVELMGSSGISLLVSLRKLADAGGGRLVVCGLNDNLVGMLKVTNLLKLFKLAKTHDDAMELMK